MQFDKASICELRANIVDNPLLPAKNAINLPNDPVGPLNRSRNHRFCSRTRAIVEQIFHTFKVPRYED
jgi:hypothetical protein